MRGCRIFALGHNVTSCRWLHPKQEDKHEHPVDKGKKPVNLQKWYMQGWKSRVNPEGIGSSKAFEVVAPQNQHESHVEKALKIAAIQQESVEVHST
jgi:hypothetical protein